MPASDSSVPAWAASTAGCERKAVSTAWDKLSGSCPQSGEDNAKETASAAKGANLPALLPGILPASSVVVPHMGISF
jgi:hypothetical protein